MAANEPVASKALNTFEASTVRRTLRALIGHSYQYLQGGMWRHVDRASGGGFQRLARDAVASRTRADPVASAQFPIVTIDPQAT